MNSVHSEPKSSPLRGGHTFHIPVMGTGFTIDTPLKVAKYGISSVVSIVDDVLIEQMRKFHCERSGEPYTEIRHNEEDSRARRITAYLDLLDLLVKRSSQALKSSPFEPGSEIIRYYELLPESPLKQAYREMLSTSDPQETARLQEDLREAAEPGSIDVNIMTKLDSDRYHKGEKLPPEYSDAKAALRGFARSGLRSSIVFSAGMNQGLYAYAACFEDFFPDSDGILKKKIVLKVSDYRSAVIQGKFLAKKGLWVSEYRIESGLNCGGHAFATKGHLMGPILEEFKEKKDELLEQLHEIYKQALASIERPAPDAPHKVRITFQGGIGTAEEDELLLHYYKVDGTGWATPFLLVPEVCNVDEASLDKLCKATEKDVYLSPSSPLGVPFWNLRTSASEANRRRRIEEGQPGSPCPKKFLVSNTEFSERPTCPASQVYQKRKLEHLPQEDLTPEQLTLIKEGLFAKACLCSDLAGGVVLKNRIEEKATPAVCCGPNIANFGRIASLEEMVGHIYGRLSLLTNKDRPHMFINELKLYVDYLRREREKYSLELSNLTPKYFQEFKENLLGGIEYYRNVAMRIVEGNYDRFLEDLNQLSREIERTLMSEAAA